MKKLEDVFELPQIEEELEQAQEETEKVQALLEKADKIDAALPEVNLDSVDTDYDNYANKSIETFDELVDLGKNVEDRFMADIFNAASNMMANALNAKTNKAKKKLEMIRYQIQKARLEHDKNKLEYLKSKHAPEPIKEEETDGQIFGDRKEFLKDLAKELQSTK